MLEIINNWQYINIVISYTMLMRNPYKFKIVYKEKREYCLIIIRGGGGGRHFPNRWLLLVTYSQLRFTRFIKVMSRN